MLDVFSHNKILFQPTDMEAKQGPSFFETVGANLGYQYAPIIDNIKQSIMHEYEVDESFNYKDHLDGYEAHQHVLYSAKNLKHMTEMKRALDANIKRREVIAESGFFYNMAAGVLDPVNVIALPFGGAGVGIARSFMRTGTSMAAIQAGQESIRVPFDPLSTEAEVATNIGTAFIAGGIIGSAVSIPSTRRAKTYKATKEAIAESKTNFQFEVTVDSSRKNVSPSGERPLAQVNQYDIDSGIEVNTSNLKIADRRIETRQQFIKTLEEDLKVAEYKAQAKGSGFEELEVLKTKIEQNKKLLDSEVSARNDSLSELTQFKKELDYRTATDEKISKVDDAYGMKPSMFTNSFVYKAITTPMKRTLQSKKVPQSVKKLVIQIAGDSGIALNLHKEGFNVGASVYQKAAIRDGEWVQIFDNARRLYGEQYGKGAPKTIIDYDVGGAVQYAGEKAKILPKTKTPEQWMEDVNIKRIKGEKPATKQEAELMSQMDSFYKTWETRLNETGLLENSKFIQKEMIRVERELAEAVDKSRKLTGKRQSLAQDKAERLQAELDRLSFKSEMSGKAIDDAAKEPFNPRYWKQDVIKARRAEFEAILVDYYAKNPRVYLFDEFKVMKAYSAAQRKLRSAKTTAKKKAAKEELEEVRSLMEGASKKTPLKTDLESISLRAKETADQILGIEDVTDPNVAFYGGGRPRHTKHRALDIPNSLVTDFIETNPMSVMKAYTAKIAPQFEFGSKLGKNIDDVLDDAEDAMYQAGMSEGEVNAVLKDVRHLDERVKGTVIRNMDTLSSKTALMLKDAAMLNYLGSAGLSTFTDYAKIIMEHEGKDVFKVLFGVMSNNRIKMNAEEGRIAGEILDIVKGDAHLRLSEMMRNNPLNEGFMSKVRNGFFLLNGVAPLTAIAKRMDSMVRVHTLIDYSLKLAGKHPDGKSISKFELEYLARYNIDKRTAVAISKMPFERTDTGLFIGNTKQWTDKNAVEAFRSSLNSGIANTVLMGTPADKPIAVDGVFYVPMHIAGKFGMKQDAKYKGYARVENGLLGLPFQFMSYSFAAANKITASVAQGTSKNRAVGLVAGMGLGYMSMELRYSDWQMDQMTLADKIARSFDQSGYMALWSDLMYTAMSTSAALDGPDLGGGIINPKFPQQPNVYDAVAGIGGAAPSWVLDTSRAMGEFVNGNFGQGAALAVKQLPTANLFWIKDSVNEATQVLRGNNYRF